MTDFKDRTGTQFDTKDGNPPATGETIKVVTSGGNTERGHWNGEYAVTEKKN